MDLYARKIVGWSLASHMRASLVCSALNMAMVTRQLAAGLVVHTDQGSQYASMPVMIIWLYWLNRKSLQV